MTEQPASTSISTSISSFLALERLKSKSNDNDLEIFSDTSSDISGYNESDAQAEWEESLQQIQDVLVLIIVPYLGKYLGRRFAYYVWAKFSNYRYGRVPVITNEKVFAATSALQAAITI